MALAECVDLVGLVAFRLLSPPKPIFTYAAELKRLLNISAHE
ncbi:hypothetical protein TERTU_4129 [Teredinibacter turnerae T7901]|uniref:Uncharacterized protein n=1 Tax=Teredinibacter turnerae (strain ATCC 39867 / T7901) TaxID=377629 RepID=C5BUH8_TERTT|nr:hypothetical protein TERTU_4129 [Teredinibacter turnerae T7901]